MKHISQICEVFMQLRTDHELAAGRAVLISSAAVTALLLMLVLSACGALGQGEPATFDAVVHGRITTPDGTPVSDAGVVSRIYFDSCEDTTDAEYGHEYIQSGEYPSGPTYAVLFQYPESRQVACANVKVYLEPYDGTGERSWAADTTVAVDLHLKHPRSSADSVRVDVVLER